MSLLDDASLVVVPSGYKAGTVYSVKPTDGTGDLSFTRSNDTATRVNSAGLIEKVRTNLVLRSEEFDNASWTKTGCTITANDTTAPDGTLTADRITITSAAQVLSQSPTLPSGQPFVFSVFVKEGNWGIVRIGNVSSGTSGAWFNVTNGTAGSVNGGTSEIINYGNGWYRLIGKFTSFSTGISFIGLSDADGSTTTSAIDTFMYFWGAQIEVSDFGATDYIPTTSAAVSVGMTANVPRLDYSGGGCPKLLLEPQRTNLVTFSEQFNNAVWALSRASAFGSGSVANAAISPDGTQSAEYIQQASGQTVSGGAFVGVLNSTGNYTISVFAKMAEQRYLRLGGALGTGGGALFCNFDLQDGVIGTPSAGVTPKIENYGNGWYRCSITASKVDLTGDFIFLYQANTLNGTDATPLSGLYLWGAQLEAGSYVSSYIPTLGAAVTRGADACLKTGISSLIGQTEGTMFLDFVPQSKDAVDDFRMLIYDGNSWIFVGNVNGGIRGYIRDGSTAQYDYIDESVVIGKRYKLALSYSSTGAAFYVNGVKVNELVSSIDIPTTSGFTLGNNNSSVDNLLISQVSQSILFPTRLTDTQAIELTTL